MPFAVGVGTGTDAITMSLKVLGVGPGDEVITTPTTFIATVGAIVMTGARPVFVDSENGFVIDPAKIEAAITPRTKAIVPVHYTGNVADMPAIADIARKHDLLIVEDACQSIGATLDEKAGWIVGSDCVLQPAPAEKPQRVGGRWSDRDTLGGIRQAAAPLPQSRPSRTRRSRDLRLQQPPRHVAGGGRQPADQGRRVHHRAKNRERQILRRGIRPNVRPRVRAARRAGVKHVFHLYVLRVKNRDGLRAFLQRSGIDARIHYPIPVHLQKAAQYLGYHAGDFPMSEHDSKNIVTLPAHQHLSKDELGFVVDKVAEFYRGR